MYTDLKVVTFNSVSITNSEEFKLNCTNWRDDKDIVVLEKSCLPKGLKEKVKINN